MFTTIALRAHLFYERGRDYLLLGDRVKIVDVATGRMSEARWMRHLHQVLTVLFVCGSASPSAFIGCFCWAGDPKFTKFEYGYASSVGQLVEVCTMRYLGLGRCSCCCLAPQVSMAFCLGC